MTRGERTLLLALFRWARAAELAAGVWPRSWAVGKYRIDWDRSDPEMLDVVHTADRNRPYIRTTRRLPVASIAEAVDLLVALGIVPVRFSTAYRAGWDAGLQYAEVAHYGAEFTRVRPAAPRELVVHQ